MIAAGDQPSEPFDMKEDQLVYESRKDDGVFNMTIQMNPQESCWRPARHPSCQR